MVLLTQFSTAPLVFDNIAVVKWFEYLDLLHPGIMEVTSTLLFQGLHRHIFSCSIIARVIDIQHHLSKMSLKQVTEYHMTLKYDGKTWTNDWAETVNWPLPDPWSSSGNVCKKCWGLCLGVTHIRMKCLDLIEEDNNKSISEVFNMVLTLGLPFKYYGTILIIP